MRHNQTNLLLRERRGGKIRCEVQHPGPAPVVAVIVGSPPPPRPPERTLFSDGGRALVAWGRGRLTAWDTRTGLPLVNLSNFPDNPGPLLVSAAGRWVGVAGRETLSVWRDGGDGPSVTLTGWYGTKAHAVSPDGLLLAGHSVDPQMKNNRIAVRDVTSGAVVFSFSMPCWGITDVAFSPDGKTLAVAGTDNPLRIPIHLLSVPEGELVATLQGHTSDPDALAFTPDGRLAAVFGGGEVRFWDPKTRQLLLTLPGWKHLTGAGCDGLTFSPDGLRLGFAASARAAGRDHFLGTWDATPLPPLP